MASQKIEVTVETSAQDTYAALRGILTAAGYDIWKERPLAYLLQAKGQIAGQDVDVNTRCSMMPPTVVTITCAGDDIADTQLAEAANAIAAQLNA